MLTKYHGPHGSKGTWYSNIRLAKNFCKMLQKKMKFYRKNLNKLFGQPNTIYWINQPCLYSHCCVNVAVLY